MKFIENSFFSVKTQLAIALGFMMLGPPFALAEDLSLEAAVHEAGSQSPEIEGSKAAHEAASARQQETLSEFLPSLSASAYHLTDVKYQSFSVTGFGVVPVVIPQTSLKLTATIPIFNGLRNLYDYRSSVALEESAMNETEWREFSVEQEVRRAYYKSIAAIRLAEVAAENIKTLEDHSLHVEARKKGGVATQYDVLRVAVQLDEARSQKILADDNVVLERKRLSRVMGLPEDARPLSGKLPEPAPVGGIQNLSVETALENRGDLIALSQSERASDLARTAKQNWWSPAIGFFTDYEFYNNTNDAVTNSNYFHNAYDVGISLQWSLFDGGASIARARESSAQLKQSQAKLTAETQRLSENLEVWKRRYQYGVALYQTSTADIQKSEESVRQAQEGFRQGIRTVSEQLDAQLDLFRSRANQVNAELTAAEAWIDLELTIGKKLNHDKLN